MQQNDFDFSAAEKAQAAEGAEPDVYTVAEITRRIRRSIEEQFPTAWIVGEISNLARPRSGHIYFTLKDDRAQISAVMWRGVASRLRFELEDGMEVVVHGSLTVYEPRGSYQIICDRIQPRGLGALQLAFEQLKKKLDAEGLFAEERKRPLPFLPRRIGVVTSQSGAAIRDILRTIHNRYPGADVVLAPVRVQGTGAAAEIAHAIGNLNRLPGVDVLIVGRGGGSLEDLWAFNEEIVARAIHASAAPVISAVGHEVDFTIADFVADYRAATPTAAGEVVVPSREDLVADLDLAVTRLAAALRNRLELARGRLGGVETAYILRRPFDRIHQEAQRIDEITQTLARDARHRIGMLGQQLGSVAGRLDSLSPLKVLERGYSITLKPDGRAVRSSDDVQPGDTIRTRVARGEITSKVERTG